MENLVNKRILITGATGFIGFNVLKRLLEMGCQSIFVHVRNPDAESRLSSLKSQFTKLSWDLENYNETFDQLDKIHPEAIIHLAASGVSVGRIETRFSDLLLQNTLGTVNLIDASFANGCTLFINTGSSSEYGICQTEMKESTNGIPTTEYGLTKKFITEYTQYLFSRKHYPIVTLRLFSVYGNYENTNRLISSIIKSYRASERPILTSPSFVRDFIYIDDVIDSYIKILASGTMNDCCINIGTGVETSIGEVVQIIKKICGSNLDPIYTGLPPNQTEPEHWVADISKMKQVLGIEPMGIEDGIGRLYNFLTR